MIDKNLRDLERFQDPIRLKLLQRRLGQGVYIQEFPRPIKVFNDTRLLIDISKYGYRFELSREGYGSGYGSGLGDGIGYGLGFGHGYSDGSGYGCSHGCQRGSGYGFGSGFGYGRGYGRGKGYLSGESERLYTRRYLNVITQKI